MARYAGILQVDGYSACTRLAKTGIGASNETVIPAGWWAHLRPRFDEQLAPAVSVYGSPHLYMPPPLGEKLFATANAARSSVSRAIFCASMTSPATR